jgi:hypothetical protein
MLKTSSSKIAVTLAIGVAILLGVFYWEKGQQIHAVSRIKIEVVHGFANPTNFYGPQFNAIERFLNDPEYNLILAKTSGTDTKNFSFEKVDRVRGTKLIYLEYTGYNSNVVQVVASNAVNLVVSLYESNFPSLKASYVDVFIRK